MVPAIRIPVLGLLPRALPLALRGLTVAALLAACTSSSTPPAPMPDLNPGGCLTNADCATSPMGHVCTNRSCVVCASSADCAGGKKCDGMTACVECIGAGDCAAGMRCMARSCVSGCDDTNPCPTGKHCDPVAKVCVSCVSRTDCSGATPACDPAAHTCVGCVTDDDCGAGKVCHAQSCMAGCSAAHPLCDFGVCNAAAGACVPCLGDNDCKSPAVPRCEVKSNSCVSCLPANDNCASGMYCAGTSCQAGCRTSSDCSGGKQCDATSHTCVTCVDDTACAAGMVCMAQKCVAGCSAQHACNRGQSCCTGACQDLLNDVNNCGMCGKACASGQGCCGGVCTSLTTPSHCGACGTSCGGGQDCCAGACAALTTKTNCGTCGTACGAGQDCCGGACSTLASDGKNCGSCGNSCGALPCSSGTCAAAGSQNNPGASCNDILSKGGSTGDGSYWLKVGNGSAFQAYCDMTTGGGGWTLCFADKYNGKGTDTGSAFDYLTSTWDSGSRVLTRGNANAGSAWGNFCPLLAAAASPPTQVMGASYGQDGALYRGNACTLDTRFFTSSNQLVNLSCQSPTVMCSFNKPLGTNTVFGLNYACNEYDENQNQGSSLNFNPQGSGSDFGRGTIDYTNMHSGTCPVAGDRHCTGGWCYECPGVGGAPFAAGNLKTLTIYVR